MRRVRRGRWTWGLIIGLSVAAWACASSPDNPEPISPDDQWEEATALFEDGKYREAIAAFQAFTLNFPQDPRATEARWMAAESYFGASDWATAALEYLNYQRDHSRDARAAEALLKAGRSYQRMSLRPELDQTDTRRAVNVYERVMSEYPGTEEAEEARERRERLRDKLAEKVYLNAEYYFDNEAYRAAEVYLEDLITLYTDTAWLPAGYALLAQTFCAQGIADRASEAYRLLLETYPESRAALEVEDDLDPACRGEGAEPAAPEPDDGEESAEPEPVA